MSRRRWTLERFLERAVEIHANKYDYSAITSDHIKGYRSKVPLTCNTCTYEWTPRIDDHINSKSGCPSCSGRLKWTLERFLERATKLNGDKYDYSMITQEHIKNKFSLIPIQCNICFHQWAPRLDNHINLKQGCPKCSGNAPMNLQRFYEQAYYSNIGMYKYIVNKLNPRNVQSLPVC